MQVTTTRLEEAILFLTEVVAPHAQEIDQNPEAVGRALREMASRDLMALKRPMAFGGPELSEPDFRRYQEECARVSGTFAFLQTQHQSAVSMISTGTNEGLKESYLPNMGNGKKQVGIGFSQLRRPGEPIMKAEPASFLGQTGYMLNGHVPWVTGKGFFDEFIVGATLPDGQALFCIVPFHNEPGVSFTDPMQLAAMMAAQTVTANFDHFFVDESKVAFIKPPGWIIKSDMINIALQGHFAIGCALGSLDVIQTAMEKKGSAQIRSTFELLSEELRKCREETATAQKLSGEETTDERLAVRAWAIELAFRCAQAAIVSSSGAANSLQHPAQRLYREALVYSVSAQTTAVMEATLKRLEKNNMEF